MIAYQGIVINKKSSYCKDRANQGRVNQGLAVLTSYTNGSLTTCTIFYYLNLFRLSKCRAETRIR